VSNKSRGGASAEPSAEEMAMNRGQRSRKIVTANRTAHSRAGSSLGDESFANNLIMFAALPYIQQMRDAIVPKSRGFNVIGVFLFFGASMASLAATTLLRRGTPLDRLWSLNPTAYNQLAPLGRIVGIFFLALAAILITAEIGWFRRRLWGWRLAVVIISTQVLGDVVNCVRGDWLRGGAGVIIAGALLLFLLQPRIRAAFS
jgi:hypothetical protein